MLFRMNWPLRCAIVAVISLIGLAAAIFKG